MASAEVTRETVEYREHARQHATTGFTPVFQSDYLFVQIPGMPVMLHQVCNGLFLQMAAEEDISCTTVEYTHSP